MAARFLVMLPKRIHAVVDGRPKGIADVTALVEEWASGLDPTRALRDAARAWELPEWAYVGTAELGSGPLRAVREAARDPEVMRAVESAWTGFVRDGRLREEAMALLLGTAAMAALYGQVGMTAAELRRKKRAAVDKDAAQRRSASDASEQRPNIAPLTDDELAAAPEMPRPVIGESRSSVGLHE